MSIADLADPRSWPAPDPSDAFATWLHGAARDAMVAATRREADAFDAAARTLLESAVAAARGRALAAALRSAPSFGVARHLRRLLAEVERGDPQSSETLTTTLFAIPLIVVAALEAREHPVVLSGTLPDTHALAAILREGCAFGGCETFALSSALVGADAIDVAALPALLANARAAGLGGGSLDLPPAPIDVEGRGERVHLRFVAGAVLTPPRVDPLADAAVGKWGIPFAQAVAKGLRAQGISVLALPRAAQRLLMAAQTGRTVQREVSAQLFASNAIRKLRASHGEPTAVISAHRAADAPGGGELRLSLSSVFAPKDAEGFRCPVYPYEAIADVAEMLHALMRDCRVADVRVVPGAHDDIDPLTHGPLFFKTAAVGALH